MTDPETMPDLPPDLRDRLGGLWDSKPPSGVREELLREAEQRLSPEPSTPVLPWRSPLPAAAAAALVGFFLWAGSRTTDSEDGESFAALDINQDRVVDVLDARDLARELHESRAGVDTNGDGTIDQADVDWIVNDIVRLDG